MHGNCTSGKEKPEGMQEPEMGSDDRGSHGLKGGPTVMNKTFQTMSYSTSHLYSSDIESHDQIETPLPTPSDFHEQWIFPIRHGVEVR